VKRASGLQATHELGQITSFIDDFKIQNVELEDRLLSKEVIEASPYLAEKLGLGRGGRVIRIERVRIADKIPFVLELQYYPYETFRKLLEIDIKGSMYRLLTERLGVDLHHSDQTLRAIQPGDEVAQRLGIKKRTPCMVLESIAYTAHNEPVEVLHAYYRGDRYTFKVEGGAYRGYGAGA
jgi:GntR family transcriptional regulator